jgi:hypothetical protein
MTAPQLLDVGSRLIGLYLLAASVPILLSVTVGWLFSNTWEQMDGSPVKIYIAITIFGLIVYMLMGWALIRKSGFVLRYVFRESGDLSGSRIKDMFTVGVKLFGAFVAMAEFLSFTRLLSNSSIMSSLLGEHGNMAESIGVATNFIPSMVSVLVGLLLFFRGELLSNWAFAERNPIVGADENG